MATKPPARNRPRRTRAASHTPVAPTPPVSPPKSVWARVKETWLKWNLVQRLVAAIGTPVLLALLGSIFYVGIPLISRGCLRSMDVAALCVRVDNLSHAPGGSDRAEQLVYQFLKDAPRTPAEQAAVLRVLRFENLIQADRPDRMSLGVMNFDGVALDPGEYLAKADLSGSSFQQAELSGVNFSGTHLDKADLDGAKLHLALLAGASLKGAHLFHADLTETNLSQADLSSADLSSANLTGAVLEGADLSYAILTGATLKEDQLRRVKSLHCATWLDGQRYDGHLNLSGDRDAARAAGISLDDVQAMALFYQDCGSSP